MFLATVEREITGLKPTKQQLRDMLRVERYPLSGKYDPEWVFENEMGPSALWLTEALVQRMQLSPGMRILDMGCGRAMSSVFLAEELGLRVWATDLWIAAADNWERIRARGLDEMICPIHAEAHSLPFADVFFDAAVSVDAYHYFGTDDLYLRYFARFVKPGGQIGIVVPALVRPLPDGIPAHLEPFWDPTECFSFHTLDWWKRHWERTELVDIEVAETISDGWRLWLQWEEARDAAGATKRGSDAQVLRADAGGYLGFVLLVARKREPR
jgi:cyclopropane fatty-acyl-phospholipid synthase-like methyltransferase